jgi:hypothetical protein
MPPGTGECERIVIITTNGVRSTAPLVDLGPGLSGILMADGTRVLTSANVRISDPGNPDTIVELIFS